MKVPHTSSRKKSAIIAVAVLLVVVAFLAWWFILNSHQNIPAVVDHPSGSSGDSIKQLEKDARKKETTPTDRPQAPMSAKEGVKASVAPIVTGFNRSADGTELLVDGGVNEIVENGGVCRFVISWQGGDIFRQTEGASAPSSTNCKTARFPMDQLPSGVNMTIQVSYDSTAYRGTSTNGPSIMKENIQ